MDASAIAMLVSQPEFALSRNAALHMENATPLALGTGTQGAGVLAVPLQSMFQQDAVALRSTCALAGRNGEPGPRLSYGRDVVMRHGNAPRC